MNINVNVRLNDKNIAIFNVSAMVNIVMNIISIAGLAPVWSASPWTPTRCTPSCGSVCASRGITRWPSCLPSWAGPASSSPSPRPPPSTASPSWPTCSSDTSLRRGRCFRTPWTRYVQSATPFSLQLLSIIIRDFTALSCTLPYKMNASGNCRVMSSLYLLRIEATCIVLYWDR